jgi:hypothetical protein
MPTMQSKRSGCLIAVELGAEWPEAAAAGAGALRRVVAQAESETPEAFAQRIGSSAARLFPPRVELKNAVVACNERTDPAALVARRAIGSALLERMGPSSTFVLAASPRSGGRLRHSLSALAIDLAPEASANVTVHFDATDEQPSEHAVARVA